MALTPDNWVMGLIKDKKLILHLAKAEESNWHLRSHARMIVPGPRLSPPLVLEPWIIYFVN